MRHLRVVLPVVVLLLTACGTVAESNMEPPTSASQSTHLREGVNYVFFNATEDEPLVPKPLRWNSCQAVHWSYNPTEERYNALPDVEDAIDQLSAATGLRFVYKGTTDASPSWIDTPAVDLLVGWVTPPEDAPDEEKASGIGGPIEVESGTDFITSAAVSLNPTHTEVSRINWRVTIFHELGHAMGLGHITTAPDSSEVMNEAAGGELLARRGYGAGDIAGLKKLGAYSPLVCFLLEPAKNHES